MCVAHDGRPGEQSEQRGASAGVSTLAKPKLLDQLRQAFQSHHHGRRNEQTHCMWVKRFIYFHQIRRPAETGEPEINAFLTHFAVQQKVSASTQNQALSALLFLYRYVISRDIGDLGQVIRARKHHWRRFLTIACTGAAIRSRGMESRLARPRDPGRWACLKGERRCR